MKKTNKMRKLMKGMAIAALLAAGISLSQAKETNAESNGVYTINEGTACKKYDITGDGKKDTILVQGSGKDEDQKDTLQVKVNDKTVLTRKNLSFYDAYTQLVVTDNHVYFFFSLPLDNGDGPEDIYEYTNEKLVKRADVLKTVGKAYYHDATVVTKATNNKITMKVTGQTNALAATENSLTYKIGEQGKLSLSTKTYKVKYSNIRIKEDSGERYTSKYLVAKKKIQVYKNANTKKKAFVVKKNEKLKVSKIHFGNKDMYYCTTKAGKKGWFVSKMNLFKDLAYAG